MLMWDKLKVPKGDKVFCLKTGVQTPTSVTPNFKQNPPLLSLNEMRETIYYL